MKGISWTHGQQGGIGYPPEIVKYKGRWYFVEDSRAHGGTICCKCSEARGIKYGFTPQQWGQPKPYGSACYRSLVPRVDKYPTPKQAFAETMTWSDYVDIVKELYGEPEILQQVMNKSLE